MLNVRKQKHKQLTVQHERPLIKPFHRQISDGVAIKDYEAQSNLQLNFKKFPEIPDLKLEKSAFKKKIDILDELGFGSLLESKAEGNCEEKKLLKRRFSIGITDFWTGQDREKFLREKGYLDAYKKLKVETLKNELKKATSIRKPELPYIMDSNAKRRASAYVEERNPYLTSRIIKKKYEFPQLSTRNSEKDSNWVGPIEKLMGKCNDLAKDTFQLRHKTELLKHKLREELNPKKKTKITLNDKKRISSIVNSMAL